MDIDIEELIQQAENGDADSQNSLGCAYFNGEGAELDYGKALYWFEKAAAQNNHLPLSNLGLCYFNGLGVERDFEKAYEYYARAVEHGVVEAINSLGLCYEEGKGVEKNEKKAFEWYLKAAEAGSPTGKYNVGMCYHRGLWVRRNLEKAFQYYTEAIQDGDGLAYNNLGVMYQNGEYVQKDLQTAFDYFKRAADRGVALGNVNLGAMYMNGLGVEVDYKKGFEYSLLGAEEGIPLGNFNVGICYYNGFFVDQNIDKAIEYFEEAAKQGLPNAFAFLSGIYYFGEGDDGAYVDEPKAIEYANKVRDLNVPDIDQNNLGLANYVLATYYYLESDDRNQKLLRQAYDCLRVAKKCGHDVEYLEGKIEYCLRIGTSKQNKMGALAEDIVRRNVPVPQLYKEIELSLKRVFGDTWDLLHSNSKKCLITALLTYTTFVSSGETNYEQMDFSNVVSPITKALEIETERIFGKGFLDYLRDNNIPPTEFNPDKQKFVAEKKNAYEPLDPSHVKDEYVNAEKYDYFQKEKGTAQYLAKNKPNGFTLGGIRPFTGIDRKQGASSQVGSSGPIVTVDKHFLAYINEVFKEDAFSKEHRMEEMKAYLDHFTWNVSQIAFNMRNPANHRGYIPFYMALICGNSIFLSRRLLQEFLQKIKPEYLKE